MPNGHRNLVVEEEALDFGVVWEQEQFQWRLPIRNPTDAPIKIKKFIASCNCVGIAPKSMLIPTGETGVIQLEMDLTIKSVTYASRIDRRHEFGQMAVLEREPDGYLKWQLRGRVRTCPIILPFPSIEFGESLIQGFSFPSTVMRVVCLD